MSKGIQHIFSQVPHTYELLNHLLTFWLDTIWRRRATKFAASFGGDNWLDVCSGTGETAAYLQRLSKGNADVVAADFSLPMIRMLQRKEESHNIGLTLADANNLPFYDNTFDLVTISFATRNINRGRKLLVSFLHEFRRVLKPGGRFINLETSQPPSFIVRRLFHYFIQLFVKPLGSLISGSKTGYAYLSYTVPRFYSGEEFSDILREAGFTDISFKHMTLGLVAIHHAVKSH